MRGPIPDTFRDIASKPGVVLICGPRGAGVRDAGFRLLEVVAERGTPTAANQWLFRTRHSGDDDDMIPTFPARFANFGAYLEFMQRSKTIADVRSSPDEQVSPTSAVYLGHVDGEVSMSRFWRSRKEARERFPPDGDWWRGAIEEAERDRALLVLSTHWLLDDNVTPSIRKAATALIVATGRFGGKVVYPLDQSILAGMTHASEAILHGPRARVRIDGKDSPSDPLRDRLEALEYVEWGETHWPRDTRSFSPISFP